MKFRTTLLMAVVLAVLCAAFWGMKYQQARSHQQSIEAKRLFHFDGVAVRRLEIGRMNETASAAERRPDGKWTMVKPDPAILPLDALWDRVANHLAQLSNEREIAPGSADLKTFGLGEPALRVAAETESGGAISLLFGDLDPTQKYRYTRLNDGPIFLVAKDEFFELDRSLNDLRDRFLVNDRESAILRIEFARIWTGKGGAKMKDPPPVGSESVPVTLTRASKDAAWRLESPVQALADQEKVDALTKEVQFAMGEGFVDHPAKLGDFGLDPASVRISIRNEASPQDQTLYVGDSPKNKPGRVYLKRADWHAVCTVDAHLVSLFPETPEAFRDRRLLSHAASDIRSLEYVSQGNSFLVEKDEQNAWKLTRPDQPGTDPQAISEYIARVKGAVAASFPEGTLESTGLDAPEVTITMRYAGSDEPGVIRIKPDPSEAGYYFATQDTGAIVRLYRNQIDGLIADSTVFRRRDLLSFRKPDAFRIELAFEGQGFVFESAHGQWVVKTPEHKILSSQNDMDLLLDALSSVYAVAQEQQAGEDLAVYGLQQPLFRVYINTRPADDPNAAPALLGPFSIGKAAPDDPQHRFASSASRPGVYRVKQELIDVVRETLKGVKDAA